MIVLWEGTDLQKAVEIERNGMTLRGMLHVPDNKKGKVPLTIMFHGFTGNKLESHFIFVKQSRALEKAGIASLRFDFLGSGESDGDFKNMTLSGELEDAEAILEYAKSLDFVDQEKIFVLGISMGGAVASMLAGLHNDDIAALCLWAPAGNMPDIIRQRLCELKFSVEDIDIEYYDLDGFLLGRGFIEDICKIDIYGKASGYKKDVFILHGNKDMTVPLSASHRYLDVYGDRGRLHVVDGADHTFNKKEWEEEVISKTTRYLTSY